MIGSRVWLLSLIILIALFMVLYLQLQSKLTNIQYRLHGSEHGQIFSIGGLHATELDDDKLVILYNRVPKTGSTSFIGLAYSLCTHNHFHVLHINTSRSTPTLPLSGQIRFARNISMWDEKKPGIYHGHLAFLDFSRFSIIRKPLYINIIRKPLDRFISYYYFLRYGDDLRPYLVRSRQGNKMTLDECVEKQHPDCAPHHLWLQVPFFCGHHAECWVPGSTWALEEAKRNVMHHYFLVGVTEELKDFVALLEYSLPRFFKGALDLYVNGTKSHLRKTKRKIRPSEKSVAKLQNTKVWRLENDFYNFVLDYFHFIRKKSLMEVTSDGRLMDRGPSFTYEKIKPKNL